jgi:hypothetical protein
MHEVMGSMMEIDISKKQTHYFLPRTKEIKNKSSFSCSSSVSSVPTMFYKRKKKKPLATMKDTAVMNCSKFIMILGKLPS